MYTIVIRAVILYIMMIITIRGMGKRQLGQYQPYELAMAMMIADLLATPMSDISTPLLHGVLPIAALFVIHSAISLLCMRSDTVRAFLSGKPSTIISKGVIDEQELKRLCLNLSDLLEGIRESGILDPAEVGTAIIEANGKISAFPCSPHRPPTMKEMNMDAGYEGIPMALVMDGRIQHHNLTAAQLTETWLRDQLNAHSCTPEQVYLSTLNTHGVMTTQIKGGGLFVDQVVDPGEVGW